MQTLIIVFSMFIICQMQNIKLTQSLIIVPPNGTFWVFNSDTRSKTHSNFYYVSWANGAIIKLDISNGIVVGQFAQTYNGTDLIKVKDFTIHGGGSKLTCVYQSGMIITWNTQTFTALGGTTLQPNIIQNVVAIDQSMTFIVTVRQSRAIKLISQIDYSEIGVYEFKLINGFPDSCHYPHRFTLSPTHSFFMDTQGISGTSIKLGTMNLISNTLINVTIAHYFNYNGLNLNPSLYYTDFSLVNSLNETVFYFSDANTVYRTKMIAPYITENKSLCGLLNHVTSVDFLSEKDELLIYSLQNNSVIIRGVNSESYTQQLPIVNSETIQAIKTTPDKQKLVILFKTHIQLFLITCQDGFAKMNLVCRSCPVGCSQCNGSCTDCQEPLCEVCQFGLVLQGSICQQQCEQGFYQSFGICYHCTDFCQQCQNSSVCISCSIGYEINNNTQLCISSTQETTKLIEILATLRSTPMINKLRKGNILVLALSDFWIYSYHNTRHGEKVVQILDFMRKIQNLKWAAFQFDKWLNITLNPSQIGFSNYSTYSNPKYFEIQGSSSTFIESSLEFLLYTIPITCLVFFFLRQCFNLTFKYRISRHFRRYSIKASLIVILMDGNVEFLSYMCFNQSKMLFSFNYIDYYNNWLWGFFFFFITFFSISFFYIVYWFYPKLCKFFLEDTFRTFEAATIYTIITNGKNFTTGAIQSLLFQQYRMQMFLILGVHIVLIVFLLHIQIKYRAFRQSLTLYTLVLQSSAKVILNFLFLIQHEYLENQTIFDALEDCLINMLYVWASIVFFRFAISFIPEKRIALTKIAQAKDQAMSQKMQQTLGEQTSKTKAFFTRNNQQAFQEESLAQKNNFSGLSTDFWIPKRPTDRVFKQLSNPPSTLITINQRQTKKAEMQRLFKNKGLKNLQAKKTTKLIFTLKKMDQENISQLEL